MKRDCFNSGTCRSSRGRAFDFEERKFNALGKILIYFPFFIVIKRLLQGLCYCYKNTHYLNTLKDTSGECPDQISDLISWDYPLNDESDLIIDGRSILVDKNITVGSLIIRNGAKLMFKDFGEGSDVLTFRAKSIQVLQFTIFDSDYINLKVYYPKRI